jgi:hypothetical protein
MTPFEKLALRGLWLILKMVMRTGNMLSGTDEVMWAKGVAEALDDDKLRNI